MIDDHDRCEWVNVSFAHPGCPRQRPEHCKMVVVAVFFAVVQCYCYVGILFCPSFLFVFAWLVPFLKAGVHQPDKSHLGFSTVLINLSISIRAILSSNSCPQCGQFQLKGCDFVT